jgi:hypothetical protein
MMNWELILMSDLVKVGVTEEEGQDIIRELWYVAAVNPAGRRFAYGALELQREAEERLALLLADGGVDPIRSDNWNEMYPVYGSAEYQLQEPELVAAEKKETLEREAEERQRLALWDSDPMAVRSGDRKEFRRVMRRNYLSRVPGGREVPRSSGEGGSQGAGPRSMCASTSRAGSFRASRGAASSSPPPRRSWSSGIT